MALAGPPVSAETQPAVGEIVHYVSHGTPIRPDGTQAYTSGCRAAIITAVPAVDGHRGDELALCVLNPTGMFFNQAVHDEGTHGTHVGGTWHWPERVG